MRHHDAAHYYEAARDDPFVAAWISVLDQYHLSPSVEVPPNDWWAAFQDFYHQGYYAEDFFRHLDTKKAFAQQPLPHVIESALMRLHELRAQEKEAFPMERRIRTTLVDDGDASTALAPRREMTAAVASPRLERTIAPRQVLADTRSEMALRAPVGTTALGSGAPPPIRTTLGSGAALERALPQRESLTELRPDWKPGISCCGRPVEVHFDEARDVSSNVEEANGVRGTFAEYIFVATCAICDCEFHISAVKPFRRPPL